MKKGIRALALLLMMIFGAWALVQAQVNSTSNNVPDYYYADYRFSDSWDGIWDIFNEEIIPSDKANVGVDAALFAKLNTYFDTAFPYLHKKFATVYRTCSLFATKLSGGYSYMDLKDFLWNWCYKSLLEAKSIIDSSYRVKANVTVNPVSGSAPLRVTFDARSSIDPSSETIPTDNFFWYYRDENWVDTVIGKWSTITHEFKEAGNFVVHLVVRSSNVDQWILDGSRDVTVSVSPKAANIVVYANTRRLQKSYPLKIWLTEWKKWVVFDGSATMPKWERVIESHIWNISNSAVGYSESFPWSGTPSYMQLPLNNNWKYDITLTTIDNEKNRVSETFSIHVSDPVTVIKQTPEVGNTSTTYTFDGGASYSLNSKLNTYFWELFDESWEKISTNQWKKMTYKFSAPGNYLVRLTVTDIKWNKNVEVRNIFVDSTTPTPQFTSTPTKRWAKPSEFTLSASNSSDIDVTNGVDSLDYNRTFSTDAYNIVSRENNGEKVVVQFNEIWKHRITLTVTDQYGKSSTITKAIEVLSILRPEIIPDPWAISRWLPIKFYSQINSGVSVDNYSWDFWDKKTLSTKDALSTEHTYAQKWIYEVRLTVNSNKPEDSNSVVERVFIWEVDYPIAAYRIRDSQWFLLHASDICDIEWSNWPQNAYEIDRQEKFTIDPSISVNTQWRSDWLVSVYEFWWNEVRDCKNQLCVANRTFMEPWCRYIDLAVKDSNSGKQDKTRIWFNVKNALPKIKNVILSFPQYSDDSSSASWLWFWMSNNKATFDCSGTNNLTVKVTAVNATDTDWNISRYRFYYYNIDDPDRILEYKDSLVSSPYAYFVMPRITWEYKFWVMVYDNDGGMIDSDEYLWSSPSVYFPAAWCDGNDVPTVTLKLSSTNVEVWDIVTYTIVSKIDSNNEDFETGRTFYYDFTGDGVWDLVTKKSSASYTFMEAYENWIQPRAAVEYRNKMWKWEWAKLLVRNWVKPILLYNSYKNKVIFRDLSVWVFQHRELCFEKQECELWNRRYRKTNVVTSGIESMTWWTQTQITQNDSFLRNYSDYWTHDVSLYLKSKFWISEEKWFEVTTSNNTSNGRIAPGINMITIPETTFTNKIPEIFLSKAMKNTLLMYIVDETSDWGCFVDTDISKDSDGDGNSDNDRDLDCNKMWKITYEPNYDSTIWRVYFVYDGQQVFQNFSVTFEWYVLEYSDEDLSLYNDITILVNGIEDVINGDPMPGNAELKSSLDVLRKNLKNRNLVSSTIMTIKSQISEWWISIDTKQRDLLNDVIERLSNEDTIMSVWMNVYEKNKQEILTMLSATSFKSEIESMFLHFEQNVDSYDLESKANELKSIFNVILTKLKEEKTLDDSDVSAVIQPSFCNIMDYYEISSYSKTCSNDPNANIIDNYESADSPAKTEAKKSFPTWLKVVLFVLWGGVLIMWWIIIFFAIKARRTNVDEDE